MRWTPQLWLAFAGMAATAACNGGDNSPSIGGDASADTTSADATEDNPVGPEAGSDAADAAPREGSTFVDGPAEGATDGGAPSLVALSVTAPPSVDGGSPGTLQPAFSPDIHDYSVQCAAGVNPLVVSMTASPGASSLLLQPTTSPALPTQTLSVPTSEGAAVVAAATNGVATVEYWVRCLPHDFPQIQWTPHPEAGAPPQGYTMIGTILPSATRGYAIVLDSNGVPVWFEPASPTPGAGVLDVDDVVPGAISYLSTADSPAEFEIHQLSPLLTTYATPTNVSLDEHDLRLLPNGDFLVISAPSISGVDLTGMQIPTADGGIQTLSGPQTIATCNLVEFSPNGSVVWTWDILDHFDPVADSVYPEVSPFGPMGTTTVYDPFHCNSIEVDPNNGNLMVSARQMASVFYIEKSSGLVLWKMGGASASKDGATYVSVADPFALQHDARFQPDWAPSCGGGTGHISLYDDEVPGKSKNARGVIYEVTIAPNASAGGGDGGSDATDGGCANDDGGTVTSAATVSWQYAAGVPSVALGSFRVRPDGSRIIGWGLIPGVVFTEVDSQGNDLVDVFFPSGNVSYRSLPAPLSAFDIGTLRATAGLP